MNVLTHLDTHGRARMVDVSAKPDTLRTAVAAGQLLTTAEVIVRVRADSLPKSDVLATARIAAISGAKKTSELIPLCHPLTLSSATVQFDFTDTAILIEATATTRGATGVEMEALTAVAIAGLTLHDMIKAVDPCASVDGIRLLTKEGGKHGHWTRERHNLEPATITQPPTAPAVTTDPLDVESPPPGDAHGGAAQWSGAPSDSASSPVALNVVIDRLLNLITGARRTQ
jgi:cyclic pyranopterin phosphate synthase